MEDWLFYALIAAVCFGVNTVIYKIAVQKGNLSPYYGGFVFGIGIFLLLLFFFFMKPSLEFEWKSSLLLILAGIIWAIGFVAIALAISKGADVARLAPIFNTNTIIAVLLSILVLKEIPDISQIFRIIAGSVLIVVGAILVSI